MVCSADPVVIRRTTGRDEAKRPGVPVRASHCTARDPVHIIGTTLYNRLMTVPSFDLTGRTALVTGGSRGIGLSIATALASAGANVVLNGRKGDALDRAVTPLAAQGFRVMGVAGNVGVLEEIPRLVDETVRAFGGLDILVNNAAANPVYGPVELATPEVFTKVMRVNMQAPFELAKAAKAHLARGRGTVINISSIGGLKPESGLGIYSVSKAAMLSLTRVLAQEWGGDGITVNAICPGLIKTDFSAPLWSDETTMQHMLTQQPIKRLGESEDVAGMALFLASDAARFVTGATFTVDGGYLA
jgi:dehydrogenase/reductase SDR family member 4